MRSIPPHINFCQQRQALLQVSFFFFNNNNKQHQTTLTIIDNKIHHHQQPQTSTTWKAKSTTTSRQRQNVQNNAKILLSSLTCSQIWANSSYGFCRVWHINCAYITKSKQEKPIYTQYLLKRGNLSKKQFRRPRYLLKDGTSRSIRFRVRVSACVSWVFFGFSRGCACRCVQEDEEKENDR